MPPSRKIPHSQPEQLSEATPSFSPQSASPSVKIPHSLSHRWMRVETYSSHQAKYCRFRWGKGRETWGYVHINGGSCTTKLVQERRRCIEEAIARGDSLLNILDLLRQWDAAPSGRKPF